MTLWDRMLGRDPEEPHVSVDDLVAQSRTVSTRLEVVADRLEQAVERLSRDLTTDGETTVDV